MPGSAATSRNLQSQRSRGDYASRSRCRTTFRKLELPRLVEEEDANRFAAGAVQPAGRRTMTTTRRRCRAAEAWTQRRILLQDQTGISREVHRACAAGFFAEARLRGVPSDLPGAERSISPPGRKLTLASGRTSRGARADYESFRRAVGADLAQQLSVENAAAGGMVPPADMKADDLVESARAAGEAETCRWRKPC